MTTAKAAATSPPVSRPHPSHPHPLRLRGAWGSVIAQRPEGAYLRSFAWSARHWRVDVRDLLAIGIVESGGGLGSSAYLTGCLDGSGGYSWPEQAHCAARVFSAGLRACGSVFAAFGYYNAGSCGGNASYAANASSVADGITVQRLAAVRARLLTVTGVCRPRRLSYAPLHYGLALWTAPRARVFQIPGYGRATTMLQFHRPVSWHVVRPWFKSCARAAHFGTKHLRVQILVWKSFG